jgi:hypothetical protein
MLRNQAALPGFCILIAAGCAQVDVRPVANISDLYDHQIPGVRCYMPQTYLQVTVTADKDGNKQYAANVVSLPDLEHPLIADVKPGWGTVNGTITLNDRGILTSIGSQLDSKIPETISAIAGLATAAKPLIPVSGGKPSIYLLKVDMKDGKLVIGDPIPLPLP